MQQIPPLSETTEVPDLGPSRRLRRRRRQPSLWVRRAIAVGVLCAVTALVGTGVGKAAQAILPPGTLGFAAELPSQVNLLVVAIDPTPLPLGPGDKATRQVADSLAVISLDTKRHRGFVLSIPRQTFVLLGEAGPGPISDALALGGMTMLRESVETVTGLTIHHHMAFELDALKGLFNQMGATRVYLPQPIDAQDKASGLSIKLGEGWTELQPQQALAYTWLRPEGDELVRLERQQMLLHDWQERAHDKWSWWWMPGLLSRSLASAMTDMPKRDFDAVMGELTDIEPDHLSYAILPGEVSAAGSWVPSPKRWDALLAKMLVAPENRPVSEIKPTIELLYNDQGDEHVMELASKLSGLGFQVLRTARYQVPQSESRIVVRAKLEEQSQAVISAIEGVVPDARVVLPRDTVNPYGVQYTLELGKEFFLK